MTKKVLPLFVLITLAACLFSYKLGSTPVALAKARPAGQDMRAETASPLTLPAPPAEWSVTGQEKGLTIGMSVYEPAVAGVQHVADCVIATVTNTSGASIAGPTTVWLYDGATVLMSWYLPQPSYTSGQGQLSLCGLNLQGTADNFMLIKIDNNLTSSNWASLTLIGHDAS